MSEIHGHIKDELFGRYILGRISAKHDDHVDQMLRALGYEGAEVEAVSFVLLEALVDMLWERVEEGTIHKNI